MVDHLHRCAEKGEEGHCPICRTGPVLVSVLYKPKNPPSKITQEHDLVEVLRTRRRTKGSVVSDSSPEPEEVEPVKHEVIDVDAGSEAEEETMEVHDLPREPSMELEFRQNNFQSSTKLNALMRDLREYKIVPRLKH
jgi:hypothetical protein